MRYKKLGRTGLLVSEICLGTMTFGSSGGMWSFMGSLEQKDADELVKNSFDAGVNFFDTANIYSGGKSENVIGASIKNLGLPRDEIVLATKVFGRIASPAPESASPAEKAEFERRFKARNISGLSRKHIMDAVDASLKRLNLDYIDLYQIQARPPHTAGRDPLSA